MSPKEFAANIEFNKESIEAWIKTISPLYSTVNVDIREGASIETA